MNFFLNFMDYLVNSLGLPAVIRVTEGQKDAFANHEESIWGVYISV